MPALILLAVVLAFPVAAPEVFLVISVILWPIVYAILWVCSLFFDATQSLPWTFNGTFTLGSALAGTAVLAVGALHFNGPKAALAILVFWGPALCIQPFLAAKGVAVNNQEYRDWTAEHYVMTNCKAYEHGYKCHFTPKTGEKLPSFVGDKWDYEVFELTPYKKALNGPFYLSKKLRPLAQPVFRYDSN